MTCICQNVRLKYNQRPMKVALREIMWQINWNDRNNKWSNLSQFAYIQLFSKDIFIISQMHLLLISKLSNWNDRRQTVGKISLTQNNRFHWANHHCYQRNKAKNKMQLIWRIFKQFQLIIMFSFKNLIIFRGSAGAFCLPLYSDHRQDLYKSGHGFWLMLLFSSFVYCHITWDIKMSV